MAEITQKTKTPDNLKAQQFVIIMRVMMVKDF